MRPSNNCCCRKAVSIAHSKCVSAALVTQHAKHTHRVILPSVACLLISYISMLSHKPQDLQKKLLNIKCVATFSTTFV